MTRFVLMLLCSVLFVLQPGFSVAASSGASSSTRIIRTDQSGLISIPLTDLPDTSRPDLLHVRRQGVELPAQIEHGRLQFIATANESPWSREAAYWISREATPGLRMALPVQPTQPFVWEEDNAYHSVAMTNRGDRWFAGELRVDSPPLMVPLLLPNTLPVGSMVELALTPLVRRNGHRLELRLAGTTIGAASWNDGTASGPRTVPLVLNQSLPAGQVSLEAVLTSVSNPTDAVLLDRLTIPALLVPLPVLPTPLPVTPSTHDFIGGPAPNQEGASYVIITHQMFQPALAPLVAAHQQRGHTVSVVDVQAIYDTFSWGERSPEAIRRFLQVASRWTMPPRSVLLVGAGNVRMRTLSGENDITYIPPYVVDADPKYGEIACDTCFARLHNVRSQLVPNLAIGRFPVHTLAEARVLVAKTVQALHAPPAGSWRRSVLAISDNDFSADGTADTAGPFSLPAERAIRLLPNHRVERFFYAPERPNAVAPYFPNSDTLRTALLRSWDEGAAAIIYLGHASLWQWAFTSADAASPHLLGLYDADARTNGTRLPILLTMSCLSGNWANPMLQPTDERLLLHPQGGTLASLSPVGSGVNLGHETMLSGVLPALASGETLGQAHLAGLKALEASGHNRDIAWSFGLLGDPDVHLPLPQQEVFLPVLQAVDTP